MKEFLDVRERKWDRDVVDSTKIAQGMVDPAPCFCFLFFFSQSVAPGMHV